MRFEPAIDRVRLLLSLQTAYGIPARALTFQPVGLEAACYVVDGAGGEKWYLKVWPRLTLDGPDAARRYASLALVRAVHERVGGILVPYPVPARDGRLWADVDGMPIVVFPFLSGTEPSGPWPPALSQELGRALATLHRATPVLANLQPPRESLGITYESGLLQDIKSAARLGADARPGLQAVSAWLRERQDDIRAQLQRLHQLRAVVLRLESPFVLCHTDLHPGNLLVDGDGRLSLLDWDDAKLAPPEHDLWSGLGEEDGGAGFAPFLGAYREAGGAGPLHLDHFAFYLLRRYLEDMAVNLRTMLRDDADEREDALWLHSMEEWCAARWSRLDATLAVIASALREHGS